MINSRTKGASAERELFKLISEATGVEVKRNLVQTREGGFDSSVGRFAIEVKRQENLDFTSWWEQAVKQAEAAKLMPMLAYRKSRYPWRVRVWSIDYVALHGGSGGGYTVVEVDLEEGISLIRKTL
jgi:Holliday junction resolvase